MAGTIELFGYKVDLTEELGSGGFGTVYKGVGTNNIVAVKKIRKAFASSASSEAMKCYTMKNVDHENIVKIYDVKTWKDSMWIFMELFDLGDLNNFYMERRYDIGTDTFKNSIVLKVMLNIIAGLTYLHSEDIVHRDIKPGNILVKTHGPGFIVKIGDFGLSKCLDPEDMTSAMSSDVGTTAFKAPEFWDREPGEKVKYHRNVDIYATGLTFAAMLQAKPGRNLIPRAQCPLKPSETNMAIGLMGFTRQKDVDLNHDPQNADQEELHQLVRHMTRTLPRQRIGAMEVFISILKMT